MGIFDNATSVVIGNKEVQSIIGPNGEVFYQKPVIHNYALTWSSATYQTDSSGDVTVSVTLTDNGVPVSGETVSFSDGSSVYTGITNNLGVASVSLNYHSNGTVTASYSNASATASIVSNYSPSYTGDLSCTPASLILNIPASIVETISIPIVSLEWLILAGLWSEGRTVTDFNNNTFTSTDLNAMIYEGDAEGTVLDYMCGLRGGDNDLLNDFGIAYLPLIRATDFDMQEEYTITYTATSATDVTITISQ